MMFIVRLHPRLLKILLNLILNAHFSVSKEGHLGDLKNAALLKILKLFRLSVIEDTRKIGRKRTQALKMKSTSLLTILRKDIKLMPYKCHTV